MTPHRRTYCGRPRHSPEVRERFQLPPAKRPRLARGVQGRFIGWIQVASSSARPGLDGGGVSSDLQGPVVIFGSLKQRGFGKSMV